MRRLAKLNPWMITSNKRRLMNYSNNRRGYSNDQGGYRGGYSSGGGGNYRNDRPPGGRPDRPRRNFPPPKSRKPAGPARPPAKVMTSTREARAVLKATCFRLARLVRIPSTKLFSGDIAVKQVTAALSSLPEGRAAQKSGVGKLRRLAMGLARKIDRLRAFLRDNKGGVGSNSEQPRK